jgi:hypothetical protein
MLQPLIYNAFHAIMYLRLNVRAAWFYPRMIAAKRWILTGGNFLF